VDSAEEYLVGVKPVSRYISRLFSIYRYLEAYSLSIILPILREVEVDYIASSIIL